MEANPPQPSRAAARKAHEPEGAPILHLPKGWRASAVAAPAAKAGEDAVDAATPQAPAPMPAGAAQRRTGFRRSPMERLLRHGNRASTAIAAVLCAVILTAVVAVGIALAPEAAATNLDARSLAPSPQHPFGTDRLGHDMLVRTVAGLSTSILIGLAAVAASSLVALGLGCAAALGGRKVDAAITWLIDLMMGIPHIILLILISYALGKGFWGVVAGIALTHWPSLARVVRAEVLQVKQAPYIAAGAKLGRSRADAARRHVLPHVLPQFLVGLVLMFPHAILHEASVTFLGFGLSPESAAIGIILSESMSYLSAGMWWLAFFPGLALVAVVMLFDACGSGIRRLLDPASSQE